MAGCGKNDSEIPTNPVGNFAKTEIYGYVTCAGQGIEGVTVSDGVEVVRTNAEGYYSFISKKKYGYVFVSIPGGYMSEKDGALPKFWQTDTAARISSALKISLSRMSRNFSLPILARRSIISLLEITLGIFTGISSAWSVIRLRPEASHC